MSPPTNQTSQAGPDAHARLRRREEQRRRVRRQRLWAIPLAAVALVIVAVAAASMGGSKGHAATHPSAARPSPPAVVSGGPIAPVRYGGLAALWAPQNVVGDQPGTAAAYEAASRRAGMPGYLLIADRGNNRILVLNPQKRIVYEYPSRSDRALGRHLFFNDDTFVEPGGKALIANEEDNNDIVEISLVNRSVHTIFGHPGEAGSDATHVHTPDDAYMLPSGEFTVADAYGCRIIFVRAHRIVRQYGTSGVCRHEPPQYLDAVNGDTPLPNGGTLLSEINGSWIDEISPAGRLVYAMQVPVSYPSDPQPLPGGRVLLADYANPGHVLIVSKRGRVLWRYGPSAGPGMLNHPSLAMALPNGDIVVNDDYRNRVVEIDPRTNRIVWQYGHTDVAGTAPGFLNTPDGMDFVPEGPHGEADYPVVVHP